jgi:hypothetical protein
VPARAIGTKAQTVEYDFKLEYDKNFQIGELSEEGIQQMRESFQMMNSTRNNSGY